MSKFNALETQITADDGSASAQTKACLAIACRTIQRNMSTQYLTVDDLDIYTDLKRQVNTPGTVSSLPAGHIARK